MSYLAPGHAALKFHPLANSFAAEQFEQRGEVMLHLRTRLVTRKEWSAANKITGSVYFIRNHVADTIKIGHSHDPLRRLAELQVANSSRLALVGIVAAAIEIEGRIHEQFPDGHAS